MIRLVTVISLTALAVISASADNTFDKQLMRSGYVHSPLPLDHTHSLEAVHAAKKVLAEKSADISRGWSSGGYGTLTVEPDSGRVVLSYPTSTGRRATGPDGDRDYAVYGRASARLDLGGADLREYNRIAFDIRPQCPGMRVVSLNFGFHNDSRKHMAGYNRPTGTHLLNLSNGQWNHCSLEIADFQRDNISELYFDAAINGRDITTGDTAAYQIANIRFQRVDRPEKVSGWEPDSDAIAYSMTGYSLSGPKTAIVGNSAADRFIIKDEKGKKVFSGKVRHVTTTTGHFGVADFSGLTKPGRYVMSAGNLETQPFAIGGDSIWDPSQWRVVNFIFGQRCGHDVPGIHGRCHADLYAVHNGVSIPYAGGWHDAGDLSQQTLQTADVAYSLLRAAHECSDRNQALAARLREEARWGIDFCLRMRFGDGYRASSMGLLIWQDGNNGTLDDISSVRVQNNPFDNYLHAAIEAYAAAELKDDAALAEYLLKTASEDFDFAEAEFAKNGLGGWISMMEHSYNTSMSQMMATVSWAASQLYALTGQQRYAVRSAEAIRYVIGCQERDGIGTDVDISGFFYRDTDRRSIVHFIHQSRDQIYMQALEALCLTQPDNPDKEEWLRCARLYGDYIKSMMPYTAPYGMIPSGVYRDDEYLDSDSFERLHLFAPGNAVELYKKQFAEGAAVGSHHAVRRFPIWFSIFNGNTAIHTSTGIGAAIAGRLLDDRQLTDIAREQLYWTVGKNPFSQSLIYGEGHRYPMLNNFSSGEITGAMPVGIRSLGDADIPYWPQINNACYKEVWVTSAGKWLLLLAQLHQ